MSQNSNDSDLGQSVDSVSSSTRKRSRVPGKANKRPVQGCVRSDFWVSMRLIPLHNTTMSKRRVELYDRILQHSANENVQASRFILGGIDYGLHGDFELFFHSKKKVVEAVVAQFFRSLYDEFPTVKIDVNKVNGGNSRNLIRSISKSDTECLWYNDPDLLTDAICESRLHERWTLMDFIKRNPDHKWTAHSNILHKTNYSVDEAMKLQRGYVFENTVRHGLQRINLPRWFNDWRDDVVCWFNIYIDFGYIKKFKALYLHGSTDTGKSTFFSQVLLKPLNRADEIFVLDSKHLDSLYAFSSWDPLMHKARKLIRNVLKPLANLISLISIYSVDGGI